MKIPNLRPRDAMIICAVGVCLVLLVLVGFALRGQRRDDSIRANSRIIDGVALYPGARELRPRLTDTLTDGLTGGVQGYHTSARFLLARTVTDAEFVEFYRHHEPAGWRCAYHTGPPPNPPEFDCRRGDAAVAIEWGLNNDVPDDHSVGYAIGADSGYAQDRDAGN